MPCCLITGANRGLGIEFARQYAAAGWRVIATCRQPAQASALAGLAGDIEVHPLDVSDFARIEALAHKLDGVAIDLLINNAGIYGPRVVPYDFVDYGAWIEALRINTMAPLKVSATFSKHVARSQRRLIIALSSMMGSITDNVSGGAYIYRSSKAALNAVMKSLSLDLRGKEIAVVVLHPGWVRTDMGGSGAPLNAEESVSAMRELIDRLGLRDSGRFYDYRGDDIPW
jgi:NAD(P)-dependent dehydrogenase (short-subunit alcohol dehydrogenase family)